MTTATKSQRENVEGIAFPPFFQESNSMTMSTIAETAGLQAEIEELKRSVQALLASNKNLREEQSAVRTQKIVESDDSRAHRIATTAIRRELPRREMSREMPLEIPKRNAVQEEPPTMVHNSTSMPTFATKSVGLSASLSEKESSGEESSVCSRRQSRKQRRAKYMRYYYYVVVRIFIVVACGKIYLIQ
jgi:cobalamin biosynthesis Mg chelatase CobN